MTKHLTHEVEAVVVLVLQVVVDPQHLFQEQMLLVLILMVVMV